MFAAVGINFDRCSVWIDSVLTYLGANLAGKILEHG
jgi:hypothetical protein